MGAATGYNVYRTAANGAAGSETFLVGNVAANLTAEYDGVDLYSHARAICRCLGGDTDSDATSTDDTNAFVNGTKTASSWPQDSRTSQDDEGVPVVVGAARRSR